MKKEEEHVIFMLTKKQFASIENTLKNLSENELKDNLTFQCFVKKFKKHFSLEEGKTYSIEEAAIIADKSERSIYRYIKTKKLYAFRVHCEWRIPEATLTKFVIENRGGYFFPPCA